MGFLSKLFGGSKSEDSDLPTRTPEEVQAECPHSTLTGRWDSVADMGYEDRATRFVCEACHAEFTPDEARRVRETTRLPITDTVHSTRP